METKLLYNELLALSPVFVPDKLLPDTAPVAATDVGVIAPSVKVIAGVVVGVATVPTLLQSAVPDLGGWWLSWSVGELAVAPAPPAADSIGDRQPPGPPTRLLPGTQPLDCRANLWLVLQIAAPAHRL